MNVESYGRKGQVSYARCRSEAFVMVQRGSAISNHLMSIDVPQRAVLSGSENTLIGHGLRLGTRRSRPRGARSSTIRAESVCGGDVMTAMQAVCEHDFFEWDNAQNLFDSCQTHFQSV